VKTDVEGAEWALLTDDRFGDARPRAIVMEYHSAGCPADNAKRFATDRLTQLGYEVQAASSDANPGSGRFWGSGMLWAWVPELTGGQSSSVR
jgi:hypothetical protein